MHESSAPGDGPVVVFSGGGTGGHLYPALALADALRELRPDVRTFFVGAERGLEARVLPERGEAHALLPVRGLSRELSARALVGNLAALWRLAGAVRRVRRLMDRLEPEVVVVTGGYAAGAAGLAAVLGRVPLVLQEQNSVPGMVTRTLARWARKIHLAFPEAADRLSGADRSVVEASGNPVRPPRPVDVAAARGDFGLEPGGRVVLVVGGSQGSVALNRAVLDAVEKVHAGELERPAGLQLLWSTGPAHAETVRTRLPEGASWVRATGFIDDMPAALAVADLAVSRAGAMATSEFLAWGLPAILVPLPTAAADHQTANARALEAAGAALHLSQAELGGPALWAALRQMVGDPDRLQAAATAARDRGRPDAAIRIAESVAALLSPRDPGGSP